MSMLEKDYRKLYLTQDKILKTLIPVLSPFYLTTAPLTAADEGGWQNLKPSFPIRNLAFKLNLVNKMGFCVLFPENDLFLDV